MAREAAEHRKWLEIGTVAGIVGSAVLLVVATVMVLAGDAYVTRGVILVVLALFLAGGAQMASFNIPTLRFVGREHRGSERYERLTRWTQLKTSSVLHNLLTLFGVLILVAALLSRTDIVQITLTGYQMDRAMTLFLLVFGMNSLYAHYQSLRVDLDPDRTPGSRVLFWMGAQLALLVGAFAAYVDFYQIELALGGIRLQPSDALVLLVAAFTLAAVMLAVGRGLPSLFSVLSDPRTQTKGGYVSQTKAVAMPTMVAFTLLFVFVLLIVVFGAGIFSVLEEVGQSRSVLLVLAMMISAVLAGLVLAIRLARQEDRIELFQQKRSKEEQTALGVAIGSVSLAVIVLMVALRVNSGGWGPFDQPSYIHIASIGILIGLGPYGFYAAQRHRRIQQIELRFPDFLRDMASSHKGGLTLVQAVQISARGEYGALTPEIRRLADQLSWNVSFEEAFRRFGDRVRTPLVLRSVNLVLEAGRSGGNTTDVLLAAARDAREIKTLERERRLNMSVYTTVIYVTFFVFLFVIGVMVGQFLPEILEAGAATADSDLGGAAGALSLGGVTEADYRQFYFIAAIVQSIGNGMLAGIMGSGNASLGLRHAFFMVLASYIAFGFIL